MGIALAHIYQLRQQFSQIDERAERLKTFFSTAKSSAQPKHANYPRARPQKLSVSFTWYHYDPKKGRYTQVREQLGGGRRVQLIIAMPHHPRFSTVLLIFSFQMA